MLYSVITAAVKQYQVESANTGHIPSVSFVTKYSIGRLVGLFVHAGDSDRQQDEAECRPSGSGAVLLGVVVRVGLFVHTGDSDRQQDEAECKPSGSGAVLLGVVVRVGLFVHTGDSDRQQDEAECKPSGSGAVLLGVVRVGLFAQRLLLETGDVIAELVVMCAAWPTATLVRRIATLMANDIAVSH